MTNIAIITNNKSQNHAQANTYLEGFNEAKIAYTHYDTSPETLSATIKKCIKKYPIILIGGGDGTIRTAAQYCAHTSIILGVLPLGTLNHFAKEMNLPENVNEIIESLTQKTTSIIDLGQVNDSIFINNSSIGIYPNFAEKRDIYSKKYNKWLSYIPGFIDSLKKHSTFKLVVKNKKLNLTLRTSFLMVSNNIYSYEFPASFKRDSFQNGLLGLYYFKQGRLRIFKLIKNLFSNKNSFQINCSNAPIEIHLAHEKEVKISLDGDTAIVKTPLYYQSLPRSLIILTKSS